MSQSRPRAGGFTHLVLLIIIAVVVLGGGFAAMSGDIAYNAQSAIAAVTGALNTAPRIEISRAGWSPNGNIWPVNVQQIGSFSVVPKNLKTTSYLTNVSAGIAVDVSPSSLKTSDYYLGYWSCSVSVCSWIDIPVASVTKSGTTVVIKSTNNLKLPVYVESGTSGTLNVGSRVYYGVAYNLSTARNVSIKASIAGVVTAISSAGASLPVDTTLAYGNWLKVLHGYGYGYGYYDYTNDNKLNWQDISLLSDLIVSGKWCIPAKYCDVNKDNQVNVSDIERLKLYAGANAAPVPQIQTELMTTSADKMVGINANDDAGIFSIRYTVRAVGGNVYVPSAVNLETTGAVPTGKTSVRIDRAGTTVTKGVSVTLEMYGATKTPAGNYLIMEGSSATFVVTSVVQLPLAGSAGPYRMTLLGVGFDSNDFAKLGGGTAMTNPPFTTNYLILN